MGDDQASTTLPRRRWGRLATAIGVTVFWALAAGALYGLHLVSTANIRQLVVDGLRAGTGAHVKLQGLSYSLTGQATLEGLVVENMEQVRSVHVDYHARRATLELDVEDARIRSAIQLLVTSTCGANVYGPELQEMRAVAGTDGVRVRRSHILACIGGLRRMAPVFAVTGCTHQAAFSDGEAIRYFFEDIGRHNAVDKIVGASLLDGSDLRRGVLVTTGRLNSEMVVKALRRQIPVLASRGAATANAIRLAQNYGLTLAGFARGQRLNAYSLPERIIDE